MDDDPVVAHFAVACALGAMKGKIDHVRINIMSGEHIPNRQARQCWDNTEDRRDVARLQFSRFFEV